MNILNNMCLEKERQIEKERNEVMANPEFQKWMKDLGVSCCYEDRNTKMKAYDLQMQYDNKRYSKLNFSM